MRVSGYAQRHGRAYDEDSAAGVPAAMMRGTAAIALTLFDHDTPLWLDPSISYSKSRTLLRPDGHLVLLWNFPIVADADLQRRLNATVFVGAWRDMAKDPDGYLAGVRRLLAEGRAELKATGCFLPSRWGILKRTRTLDAQLYAQWLSSLSNTAANWNDMAERVRAALLGEDSIRILDYVYMSAARRR